MGSKDKRVDAYIKKAAPFAQPILECPCNAAPMPRDGRLHEPPLQAAGVGGSGIRPTG